MSKSLHKTRPKTQPESQFRTHPLPKTRQASASVATLLAAVLGVLALKPVVLVVAVAALQTIKECFLFLSHVAYAVARVPQLSFRALLAVVQE